MSQRSKWLGFCGWGRKATWVCVSTTPAWKTFAGRHFQSHLFKTGWDHCYLVCWGLGPSFSWGAFQPSLRQWLSEPRVPVLNLVPQDANLLTWPSSPSLSSWLRAIQVVRSHSVINERPDMENIPMHLPFRQQQTLWNSERGNQWQHPYSWMRLDVGHFYILRLWKNKVRTKGFEIIYPREEKCVTYGIVAT